MIVRPGIPESLRWFADARFGMFVHFGVYALLGRGEWVMYHERIPRDEYRALGPRFNPNRFDADEWVRLAEDAGARYITCTAKHHDGFCLFDSALTDWKMPNTPFARDLIGELIAACQKSGMRICLYYSQPDWMHPAFPNRHGAFKDWPEPRPGDAPDADAYLDYYIGQVRELCTNYGRIDGIWFDGSHKTVEDWRGREVYDMIKRLQPGAIVNDRARCGDMFTPERSLPDDLSDYLFEACESTSPTSWGFQGDTALFAVPHLVESLAKMTSAGGNYLLNVGPAPDGTIPRGQAERMRGVGAWLARHGEAIYGTQSGPALPDPNLRATVKGDAVYIHLLRWPIADRVRVPGLAPGDVAEAALIGGQALAVGAVDGGIEIAGLPAMPVDPSVNVIRLALARVPETFQRHPAEKPPAPIVPVSVDGPTLLRPEDATREGRGVKGVPLRVGQDAASGASFITGWMTPEHAAHWEIAVSRPGAYEVVAAARPHRSGLGGGTFAVVAGNGEVVGGIPETGDPPKFRTIPVGRIDLPAGRSRVTLRAKELLWGYLLGEFAPIVIRPV